MQRLFECLDRLYARLELVQACLGDARAEESAVENGLRQAAEAQRQGGDALTITEAVFERHPASKAAFEAVSALLKEMASGRHDLLVRREAVLRLKAHAERYRAACAIEELPVAQKQLREVSSYADQLMNDLRERQRSGLVSRLEELEKHVKRLAGKPGEDALEAIGHIDERIDKDLLRHHPDLRTRYETTSRNLVGRLQSTEDEDAKLKRYNVQAMEAVQKAWKHFDDGKQTVGADKFDLGQLAGQISGWEARHLHQATSTYLSSVYGEIFQRLKPDARLEMTRRMLQATPRPL